jgi:lysozyme
MSAYRNKKTSKNNYQKFLKPVLWLFMLLIVIITSYKIYPKLQYYLGFKNYQTDKLTAKQRALEDERIDNIVANHKGKIFGLDISQYQGTIDFDILEAKNEQFEIKFVIARATAGRNFVDKKFKRNWTKLTKSLYIQGAYHYYRPDENSTEQAQNFIHNVTLRKGNIPPILDIEKMPKNQSIAKMKEGIQNWLNLVEKHYQVKPILYTGEKYYEDFLKEDFKGYAFWIANYNPWKEKIHTDYLLWQFTEKASVIGINELVDVNVFNGDVDALRKICLQ